MFIWALLSLGMQMILFSLCPGMSNGSGFILTTGIFILNAGIVLLFGGKRNV